MKLLNYALAAILLPIAAIGTGVRVAYETVRYGRV